MSWPKKRKKWEATRPAHGASLQTSLCGSWMQSNFWTTEGKQSGPWANRWTCSKQRHSGFFWEPWAHYWLHHCSNL